MRATMPARAAECLPRPAARAAADRVRAAGGSDVRIGVVLGTGLGSLTERLESPRSLESRETGWLATSRATGHAGRVVCGTIDGVAVAMLQGRVHAYEGFPAETLTRGVEFLAALGAETLLLTNASGGLRPDMAGGDLVVVTDHLDFVRRRWDEGITPDGAATARHRSEPFYQPALVEAAIAAARRAGARARPGVYGLLSGPSYETRAEYRMLRRHGADVVGMSTVPEVVAAARLGIATVVCSVVTNVARPDAPSQVETDAEDVCQTAAAATAGVWAILEALVARERG